jgi:hypothetical protein
MKTQSILSILSVFIIQLFLSFSSVLYGQVWNREIVDSTGIENGIYRSLAIDQYDNPHIVYYNSDFYDLKYAYKNGNVWDISVIDSIRVSGISCDIAFDSNNTPHVCFQDGCNDLTECFGAGLQYMTITNGEWVKETVFENSLPFAFNYMMCSIEINSQNQPVIAFYEKLADDNIKIATKSTSGWNIQGFPVVKGAPINGDNLNFRLKGNNTPVIQYIAYDSLFVVECNLTTGNFQKYTYPVKPDILMDQTNHSSFDLDEQDNLHIVYESFNEGNNFRTGFYYAYFNWDEWEKEELFYTANKREKAYIKIINSRPRLVTIYQDNLVYSIRNNNQWTEQIIDTLITAQLLSFEHDINNYPHIAVCGRIPELAEEKENCLIYYRYYPGASNMEVSTNYYDFENVWIESYSEYNITVKNKGVAPLAIDNIKFDPTSAFKITNKSQRLFIPVNGSAKINVRFTPQAEQNYSDILQLITNDPAFPVFNIQFSGTGVSSGTNSSITVQINDIIADLKNLAINKDERLQGVEVRLFQNNEAVTNMLTTNAEGLVSFNGLTPGFYVLKTSKMVPHTQNEVLLSVQEEFEIGPGKNTRLSHLPDSLYKYKFLLIEELNQIEASNSIFTGEYFTYQQVETNVETLLKNWAADYDSQKTEVLARLLLTEMLVKDLFEQGMNVSNEMFCDFGDLIGFIFYSNDWSMTLIELIKAALELISSLAEGGSTAARKILMELLDILIKELIKQEILASVTESVELVGAKLGHPADIILIDGWRELKNNYSSMNFQSFSAVAWDEITLKVFKKLKGPFIQEVYINLLTAPVITKALDYSETDNYSGTFANACISEIEFVADEENNVENIIEWASGLRETANLFMTTARILEVVAAIDPTGIVKNVAQFTTYIRLSAYVEVITALGLSTSQFFILPANMNDEVDDIYFSSAVKKGTITQQNQVFSKSKYTSATISNIKKSLQENENSFDSILYLVQQNIESGSNVEAASELLKLNEAEKSYSNTISQSYAPLRAVASEASQFIPTFEEHYDSLISYKAKNLQEWFNTYLLVTISLLDTAGQMTNTILDQIDKTKQVNHLLTSHIGNMLDDVSENMEVPGVIVVSQIKQDKYSLKLGETGTARLKLKNVGASEANNIRLKMETSDALNCTQTGEITVGTLAPGEESEEYVFTFNIAENQHSSGLWDAIITCDDAAAMSKSGAFTIEDATTSLQISKQSKNAGLFCFPNPVNSSGTIFYELQEGAEIKIQLFDITGREVKTLYYGYKESGKSNLSFDAASLSNGIYIIKMHSNNYVSGTSKVVINH